METNSMSIPEAIEQRRLAITEALIKEAEAITEAEVTLLSRYEESVQSVCDGLINNMEEQGKELFLDFKKSNDLLRQSITKTRGQLLKVLLPTALILGALLGGLATHQFSPRGENWVNLDEYKVTKKDLKKLSQIMNEGK